MLILEEIHEKELNSIPVEFDISGSTLFVRTNDCCKCVHCYPRLRFIAKGIAPKWFECYPSGKIIFVSNKDGDAHAYVENEKGNIRSM